MKSLFDKRSLRFRLSIILSLAILLCWAVSTALAWRQTTKEINDVFDVRQILLAKRLSGSNLRQILEERYRRGGYRDEMIVREPRRYDEDSLVFAIFTPQGERLLSDDEKGEKIIFAPVHGFANTHLQDENTEWRIFWLPSADRRTLIAVGEDLKHRQSIVNRIVFSQMGIWLVSLPIFILFILWMITRETNVINRVTKKLLSRSPENQQPIKASRLPTEIVPLVDSLNGFFARTSSMLLRERRFTSDAAHELRSPLAALRIQTEIAQLSDDDPKIRKDALKNLTKGIDRASQLIEQLLTLSRLDNLKSLDNLGQIRWDALLKSVISELYFTAQKRRIELDFERRGAPRHQLGQPLLLSLMVRNLVDNAIRYCPEGSKIRLILKRDCLTVEDNGGGVAESDLAKLGQRFYRPAGQNEKGSGLGLSIVHRIAELHNYQVKIENIYNEQAERSGLRITIRFS